MNSRAPQIRGALAALVVALSLGAPGLLQAQGAGPTRPTARASAPIDLTGYWVAVIVQDWRWRMVTPAKGDYAGVPINAEAKKAADTWDPAKDEASGAACKSYGAPGLMRGPTRLHITWQDDDTLKVETDYGMQTRLFDFAGRKAPAGPGTLQGESMAEWERAGGGRGAVLSSSGSDARSAPQFGDLKVVTNRFSGGYLRKNGVPYGTNAVLTEYWDLFKEPNGDQRIMIATRVADPQYLSTPWLTVMDFKKESSGAKWDPTACSASW